MNLFKKHSKKFIQLGLLISFSLVFLYFGFYSFELKPQDKFKLKEVYQEMKDRDKLKDIKTNDSSDKINLNKKFENLTTDSLISIMRESFGTIGKDNRKNYFELEERLKREAEKTAIIIDKKVLLPGNDGKYSIKVQGKLGLVRNLCEKQKFYSEPCIENACSGFAIDNNLIVTAGHCINQQNYREKYILFGFFAESESEIRLIVPEVNVYEIENIMDRQHDYRLKQDFAILKVNKQIPINRIVNIRRKGTIVENSSIFMIGYPLGLSLKCCDDAKAFFTNNSNYFISDLDAYESNSGSAVYSVDENGAFIVEGILVESNLDFKEKYIETNLCNEYFYYPQLINREKDGARVSKISQIWNSINKSRN